MENEAELSGSEAASDDEDERGLDRLELEDGDLDDIDAEEVRDLADLVADLLLDDIDAEEVRDQVGKIAQRQALDQDVRDVRLFQEAFLEDGELHSDNTRNRRFKWLGIGETLSIGLSRVEVTEMLPFSRPRGGT